MPQQQPPKRKTITGTVPAGSYANAAKGQLQGAASNRTAQELAELQHGFGNSGEAVRQSLTLPNGVPFAQFQTDRHSPQGQALKASYLRHNNLDALSDADYQGRVYDEALSRFHQQAAANPNASALNQGGFTAGSQDARARVQAFGNFAPGGGGMAGQLAREADRFPRIAGQAIYAAPGMAVQAAPTVVVAPPAPAVARRVIRGAAPVIASN